MNKSNKTKKRFWPKKIIFLCLINIVYSEKTNLLSSLFFVYWQTNRTHTPTYTYPHLKDSVFKLVIEINIRPICFNKRNSEFQIREQKAFPKVCRTTIEVRSSNLYCSCWFLWITCFGDDRLFYHKRSSCHCEPSQSNGCKCDKTRHSKINQPTNGLYNRQITKNERIYQSTGLSERQRRTRTTPWIKESFAAEGNKLKLQVWLFRADVGSQLWNVTKDKIMENKSKER